MAAVSAPSVVSSADSCVPERADPRPGHPVRPAKSIAPDSRSVFCWLCLGDDRRRGHRFRWPFLLTLAVGA